LTTHVSGLACVSESYLIQDSISLVLNNKTIEHVLGDSLVVIRDQFVFNPESLCVLSEMRLVLHAQPMDAVSNHLIYYTTAEDRLPVSTIFSTDNAVLTNNYSAKAIYST